MKKTEHITMYEDIEERIGILAGEDGPSKTRLLSTIAEKAGYTYAEVTGYEVLLKYAVGIGSHLVEPTCEVNLQIVPVGVVSEEEVARKMTYQLPSAGKLIAE